MQVTLRFSEISHVLGRFDQVTRSIVATESVRADEILTAFVELERAMHEFAVDLIS